MYRVKVTFCSRFQKLKSQAGEQNYSPRKLYSEARSLWREREYLNFLWPIKFWICDSAKYLLLNLPEVEIIGANLNG